MIPVLCIFAFAGPRGLWHESSLMIEVPSSSLILETFDAEMRKRQENYVPGLTWGPRPERWKLISYKPQNGRREFDARH